MDDEAKQEKSRLRDAREKQLVDKARRQSRFFRFNKVENVLYCVVEVSGQAKLITWSLETAL